MNIATKFKELREENGLTQEQLAKQTGLSQGAISHGEKGIRQPNITQCVTLANYYGITLDELVGRDKLSNFSIDQRHNNGTINNNF